MREKWKNNLIKLLKRAITYIEKDQDDDPDIEILAPIDNLSNNDIYLKSLDEAIRHSRVYNICLSGEYGAGKSSIIESFKKKYSKYKCMNISLANFIEKEQGDSDSESVIEEMLEKGILKQLFYKVNHKSIPSSRFSKINDITWCKAVKYILCLVLVPLPIIVLYLNNIMSFINDQINKIIEPGIGNKVGGYIVLSITVLISLGTLAYLYLKIFNRFNLTSIKKDDFEINIAAKEQESNTFDKYLDEIIYFFKKNDYAVIFFEDLDRFNNIEIFTRLRDLNRLINESEEVFSQGRKNKIKFVYAVKDSIFYNKIHTSIENNTEDNKEYSTVFGENRTKFFDYIIPVIPTMDSNNSYSELKNLFKKQSSNSISDDLINDISFFIDDKRILINTFNEYVLYHKIIGADIPENQEFYDKLFAIILYKNVYPIDFSELKYKKGFLYKAISKKEEYMEEKVGELQEKIQRKQQLLLNIDNELLGSEDELFGAMCEELKQLNIKYIQDRTYNNRYYASDWSKEYFKKFKDYNKIIYTSKGDVNSNDLFKFRSNNMNYFKRLDIIKFKDEEKRQDLENDLKVLKQQKDNLYEKTLADLLSDDNIDLDDEFKDKALLKVLLRNGYIDEKYNDYISRFKPGEITLEEQEFIKAVKVGQGLDVRYELNNVDKIINKINLKDFKKQYILNLYLVKYFIENIDKFKSDDKFIKLIDQFKEINNYTFDFLNNFKEFSLENYKILIREISEVNYNLFYKLCLNNNLGNELKEENFNIFIQQLSIDEILKQNGENVINNYIKSRKDFLSMEIIDLEREKIIKLLNSINIKFEDLDINYSESAKDVVQAIYDNDLYMINNKMLELIYKMINNLDDTIPECLTYTIIFDSKLERLKKYILDNIDSYIESVFLSDEYNGEDEEKYIIELLNSEDISERNKQKIISSKKFILNNIEDIKYKEFYMDLLKYRHIKISWDNVNAYFEKKSKVIDEILIDYLSDKDIIKILRLEKMSDEDNGKHLELQEAIILDENISNAVIKELRNSFGSPHNSLQLSNISEERLKLLIDINIIELSSQIYNDIYEKNNSVYLIIKCISTYIEDINDYELKKGDIRIILESDKVTNDEKIKIIKLLDEEEMDINSNYDIIKNIICDEDDDELNEIKEAIKQKMITNIKNDIENMTVDEVKEKLSEADPKYTEFLTLGGSFTLSIYDISSDFLELLKDKEVISSYDRKENYFKINRKKKQKVLQPS